eukprot:scaffold2089_cov336-Prasinococcus_capsulatus_cf.AAC.4
MHRIPIALAIAKACWSCTLVARRLLTLAAVGGAAPAVRFAAAAAAAAAATSVTYERSLVGAQ